MAKFSLALLAAGAAAARLAARADASAWASTSDLSLALSKVDAPTLGGSNSGGLDGWNLTIKDKTGHKQTVKGFGACVTDATVSTINELPDDARSQLLADITGPDGLNFNLLRHTIASSDLSADPAYSYDDNGGKPDTSLASFGLGDRGTAMAGMLAELRKLRSDLTLLGSPWSPPGWMQKDGVITGTTTNNNLDHQYADQFAQYFVKYLQAYEKAGAHVDAITIQNEPLNSRAQMPTMYIFANESASLIQDNVGPALRDAGLKTEIWAFDHNTDDHSYAETVVQTAGDFVPAAAWHCYSGNDPEHWAALTDFHGRFPDVLQYMTECYTAAGTTDWVHSSSFNLLPLQNWASGIIAWTLSSAPEGGPALSGGDACSTCTGLVTVDGGAYKKTSDYYMMGQFSRFIPAGATVVDGSGSNLDGSGSGVESVATVNPDGSRTVVIQNRSDNDLWVTLGTETDSDSWNGKVSGKSVTTWVLPA